MSNSSQPRLPALATGGFAVAMFIGGVATPTPPLDVAARLESLSHDVLRSNVTYVSRMLTLVLLTPTIIGLLRLLPLRGSAAGKVAATLLVTGLSAGAVVTTVMAVQATVLAPAADRRTAVEVTGWLDDSPLWTVGGAFYLLGWLLGFAALGIALWRARAVPRWAAVCVGVGPLLHIAGGDLPVTVIGGSAVLMVGLLVLSYVMARGGHGTRARRRDRPVTSDPAELLVSADAPHIPAATGRVPADGPSHRADTPQRPS